MGVPVQKTSVVHVGARRGAPARLPTTIGLDFATRWLVHDMPRWSQAVSGGRVWLPREIHAVGEATFANGSYDIGHGLEYFDYREAESGSAWSNRMVDSIGSMVRLGGRSDSGRCSTAAGVESGAAGALRHRRSWWSSCVSTARYPTRVLQIAGVAVGDRVTVADVAGIRQRLIDSGRFGAVEVLRRYRSLTPTDRASAVGSAADFGERQAAAVARAVSRSSASAAALPPRACSGAVS